MHISKFRIKNYKSYLDSGEIYLSPSINIITGQNNAGKTAILQTLSLNFKANPHKSIRTFPTPISIIDANSEIEFEIEISKEELINYLYKGDEIILSVSNDSSPSYFAGQNLIKEWIKETNAIICTYQNSMLKKSHLARLPLGPQMIRYAYRIDKSNKVLMHTGSTGAEPTLNIAMNEIKNRIYFFHAERLNIGSCGFGTNSTLKSDASNLPEVLEILQGDLYRFERYNNYVKKIFPQIYRVSVRPAHNQQVEIVVWNEHPKFERSDLVVPLKESGTGLGQVLAILYVVLTSNISKVIIIDEPNSFLHPGAARKLIEILKEHPQHQFIISTHSPSTIAAANPKTINIIRTENAESKVEAIDVRETQKQQVYLAEIGAKLSDVFGADNILWVEGKTEEICFPKIIEITEELSLMGTTIVGVKNTGDFQNSELIFQVYEKLSKGKGLLPAAVGFVFDKEEHTDNEITDLKRRSGNKVHFIARKMYENYLLNPKAIVSVLNSIDGISISEDAVINWIEANRWDKKLIKLQGKKDPNEWLEKVDGAKLLDRLFAELTEARVKFDKITHSVAITEWIIDHSAKDLIEIQELLRRILQAK